MINSMLMAAALCTASCSQADSQNRTAPQLPAKFMLNCGTPSGTSMPGGTEKGFKILVNRVTNEFSFSWEPLGPWPIQKLERDKITLTDGHVEHGIDGNPEERRIVFNLRTGVLQFHEAYAGFVPVDHTFSSHCEIANA